jgi:glycerol-3-phosphate dehydrogenase
MARTVEDVLARRTRALFLNAKAAMRMASRVASLMALELHRDGAWQTQQMESFGEVARNYCPRLGAGAETGG